MLNSTSYMLIKEILSDCILLREFTCKVRGISLNEITWTDLKYENRNKTGSFEDLCRTLFLRSNKRVVTIISIIIVKIA